MRGNSGGWHGEGMQAQAGVLVGHGRAELELGGAAEGTKVPPDL